MKRHQQLPERRVDYPVIGTNSGKVHIEVETPHPGVGEAYVVICGAWISDGYRSRAGGLVTCQRCLRVLAQGTR